MMLTKSEAGKLRSMLDRGGKDELPVVFRTLGDSGRFRIFSLLGKEERLYCVSEIASVLKTSVPSASQQLQRMERSGLVIRERIGQKICYQVDRKKIIVRSLLSLINH